MATALNTAPAPSPDVVPITPPRSSKRLVTLSIVALLVVVAIGWGVKRWSYGRVHETTDNAQVDGDIVPVLAKVGGYVNTVSITENQPIAQNAVVVTIDDAELRVRLAQAEADLAAAQSVAGGSGQAQAQVSGASSQHASLEAQIAAARANQQ